MNPDPTEPHVKLRLRDAVFASSARMEVKSILYALIHRADAGLTCTPSIPRIAKDAGMNEETAGDYLRLLVAAGVLSRRERWEGARQTSPEWRLHEADLQARLSAVPKPKRGGFHPAKGGGKDAPTVGANIPLPPNTDPGGGKHPPRVGANIRHESDQ